MYFLGCFLVDIDGTFCYFYFLLPFWIFPRLPLILELPTVLQIFASFLVLHAVIANFSFGDKNLKLFSNSWFWWLKRSMLMQLMQHTKMNRLIIPVSEKSRKTPWRHFFLSQKIFLFWSYWAGFFFMKKNLLQKKSLFCCLFNTTEGFF